MLYIYIAHTVIPYLSTAVAKQNARVKVAKVGPYLAT